MSQAAHPLHDIQCILFDLDGTLLDTSYDFAYALNQVLREFGGPRLRYQDIRKTVSQGGLALTKLAFPALEGEELENRRKRFLDIYFDNITNHTRLFPGLEKGLEVLAERGIPWGIVTNKPTWLTETILQRMTFPSAPLSVIAGDTLAVRKPDPAPMHLAAKECGVAPAQCLYIGDHPRDIEAGINAGMKTGAALFGFLPEHESDAAWPADFFFDTPIDISRFIETISKNP
jgi:phosphoglycolate phosphatase